MQLWKLEKGCTIVCMQVSTEPQAGIWIPLDKLTAFLSTGNITCYFEATSVHRSLAGLVDLINIIYSLLIAICVCHF